MKATIIQHKETKEIIMYFINDTRVTQRQYHDEINRHLRAKVGCYNTSFTSRTRSGNFRHTAYYSI